MSEKIGNWQTFGTEWNGTKLVIDADWGNDDAPITMAAVFVAAVKVGDIRKNLALTHEEMETAEGAKKAVLPLILDSVARCAEADEDSLKEYGIMIGKQIHDVAVKCVSYPRDIEEIGRFDHPRSESLPEGAKPWQK